MKVIPFGKILALDECRVGSLVQSVDFNESHLFGIACRNQRDEIEGILYFANSEPTFLPLYGQGRTLVLQYEGELIWHVKHDVERGTGVDVATELSTAE